MLWYPLSPVAAYSLCQVFPFYLAGVVVNPFTTRNPFLGTKILGFSIGRGSGALKGLSCLG